MTCRCNFHVGTAYYECRRSLGKKAILLSGKGLYREDFYFVAKKDFVKNNQMP